MKKENKQPGTFSVNLLKCLNQTKAKIKVMTKCQIAADKISSQQKSNTSLETNTKM